MNAYLTPPRLRLLAALFVAVVFSACGPCAAVAAAPEFVGVLAIALEDAVAKDLQLTDAQKTKLLDLVDARENEAVDLAMQVKELPAAEREAKLASFRRESETKGLALLTPVQQSRLEKIRFGRLGMASLAEPAIAEQLILTEEQQRQVAAVLKDRSERLAGADEKTSQVVHAETERKLAAVLTGQQQAAWDALASTAPGSGEASQAPASTSPAGKTPAEAPTTVAQMPPHEEPAAKTPEEPEEPEDDFPMEPGEKPADKPVKLRFSFRFAPWKDVLDWFTRQADLSLVTEVYPPGTFNYTDQREYTPAQAIDVLNSVLLTKGFTLVMRDRAVYVIDLKDPIPPNLVSTVAPEDLDDKPEFLLVCVLFQLDKLTPEEAEAEIKKLLGPQGSIVTLPKSRQIQVTETAGRLRGIRAVIRRFEDPAGVNSGKLRTFDLQYATPADALAVMRQFLDIPETGNAAPDGSIRFAIDPSGKRLLATGKQEKLDRAKDILEIVDVPKPGQSAAGQVDELQLEVYSITAADPQSVLAVLQTLMAGMPDVRLAIDSKTGNLVAMARPSQHATIRATLDQLQRDARCVEVFHLHTVDPQTALQALNNLFGADPKGPPNPNAPQINADPTTRQLLVRGNKAQIEQIRTVLEKMGETDTSQAASVGGSNVRMLPLKGRSAASALEKIQEIWPSIRGNKIRIVTPSATIPELRSVESGQPEVPPPGPEAAPDTGSTLAPPSGGPAAAPEVRPGKGPPAGKLPGDKSAGRGTPSHGATPFILVAQAVPAPAAADESEPKTRLPAVESGPPAAKAPAKPKAPTGNASAPIIVAPGPGGIMIASEDVEALNQFEDLLKNLAGGPGSNTPEMTIFYLKYAKAAAVAETLDQIFGGGTMRSSSSSGGPGGGGLLGNIAGAAMGEGGGLLGSLLGIGGEGGTIAPSGSIKITPDPRLNALVVQANETDVATIEQLLKILDQKSPPEDPAIVPKAKMIALRNTQAEEIVNILREVYQDRLVAAAGQGGRPPSPQDFMMMLRGGGGRRGGGGGGTQGKAQEESQKMTVSVDVRTNSIVLAAPEPLFTEVQKLIEQLDNAALESNQAMQVVTLHEVSTDSVQQALAAIAGNGVQFARSGGSRARPSMRGGQQQPNYAGGRMQGGYGQGGFRPQGGGQFQQPYAGGAQTYGGGGRGQGGNTPRAGGTGGFRSQGGAYGTPAPGGAAPGGAIRPGGSFRGAQPGGAQPGGFRPGG